jgi:hypothetical protein
LTRYAAFYCEENVWWLAREPRFAAAEVVVISNRARTVAMDAQRAGEGRPLVWDYHVVLAVPGAGGVEVWDLDTTLGLPVLGARWLEASFDPGWPARFAPRFRPMPAERYVAELASDRRHMRAKNGRWRAPPPEWPIIGGGAHELDRMIDVSGDDAFDLATLSARWRRAGST